MLVLLLGCALATAAPPLDHHGQLLLGVAPGVGYRVIFPYSDGQPCGDAGKRVCASRLPWFLELSAGYGVTGRLDLIVDLRFGLEQDFNASHVFFVAPGVRFFVDPADVLKLYTTLQAVFDDEDQGDPNIRNADLGVRNANGLSYELARFAGVFAQFGETLGVLRWLRLELDVAFGVQGRFP